MKALDDEVKLEAINCPEETDVHKDKLTADADLNSFMKESGTSLATTSGRFTHTTMVNICNSARRLNIATLYLVKFFGLSVPIVINDFVYNPNKNYVYPNSSVDQTWILPPNNLKQAYWTVISYYTSDTEPSIR